MVVTGEARIRVNRPNGESVDEIIAGAMSVGRHPECDVVVPEPSVSKLHCTLAIDEDGELVVINQSATNGVTVNHLKVQECRLRQGDIIGLGLCTIVVVNAPEGRSEEVEETVIGNVEEIAARQREQQAGRIQLGGAADQAGGARTVPVTPAIQANQQPQQPASLRPNPQRRPRQPVRREVQRATQSYEESSRDSFNKRLTIALLVGALFVMFIFIVFFALVVLGVTVM